MKPPMTPKAKVMSGKPHLRTRKLSTTGKSAFPGGPLAFPPPGVGAPDAGPPPGGAPAFPGPAGGGGPMGAGPGDMGG